MPPTWRRILSIGVGNSDPSSHEPDQFIATEQLRAPVWQRRLFNGLAQIIVQSTKEPGEIKLTARADGITPVTAVVQAEARTPRPSVP
jgi:beta-galactosidase